MIYLCREPPNQLSMFSNSASGTTARMVSRNLNGISHGANEVLAMWDHITIPHELEFYDILTTVVFEISDADKAVELLTPILEKLWLTVGTATDAELYTLLTVFNLLTFSTPTLTDRQIERGLAQLESLETDGLVYVNYYEQVRIMLSFPSDSKLAPSIESKLAEILESIDFDVSCLIEGRKDELENRVNALYTTFGVSRL
jgi:hypothetical protein